MTRAKKGHRHNIFALYIIELLFLKPQREVGRFIVDYFVNWTLISESDSCQEQAAHQTAVTVGGEGRGWCRTHMYSAKLMRLMRFSLLPHLSMQILKPVLKTKAICISASQPSEEISRLSMITRHAHKWKQTENFTWNNLFWWKICLNLVIQLTKLNKTEASEWQWDWMGFFPGLHRD